MITILTDEFKKELLSLPEVEAILSQTLTIVLKEKPNQEFIDKMKLKLDGIRFNLVYNGGIEKY